jgi:hypothetical protein
MATQIEIGEIAATLHTVDGSSPLSRPALDQLVKLVIETLRQQQEQRDRADSERRITGGVSAERDAGYED